MPTPKPAKVARMMDITACKWSCNALQRPAAGQHIYIHITTCSEELCWLVYAYISVEEMGEEDDQEELNRRVDPYVSSCHCTQCKVLISIMASSESKHLYM